MRVVLGALVALALPAALLAPVGAVSAASAPGGTPSARVLAAADREAARRAPALDVRRQVSGLTNPWDVQPIGTGRLLVTERDSARLYVWDDGKKRRVAFPSNRIWTSGETGLMSLAIDQGFGKNGRFYTCSGWNKSGGGRDVRVTAWKLNDAATRARRVETVVGGFPTSSGRHGGCRLLITDKGAMVVGTGDAAIGSTPRNLKSLGGKTLRLDPRTGKPWKSNPFAKSANKRKRYVFTYGHRNLQGLAQRKDGSLWSAEHGPDRDDEVNRLKRGGDYGWHPVPGYNESVPMTDQSLPGRQVRARWSSGSPTRATSGAAWVRGKKWGRYNGTLAVAALKSSRVIFMKFDKSGTFKWAQAPSELQQFGRLRSITNAPNNDLLVTTSNGGNDHVLRVKPRP